MTVEAATDRTRTLRREAAALVVAVALVYSFVAVLLHTRAPDLFDHLDAAFDADLGSWTVDIAREQGPHARTRVHPISVLLLNPVGWTVRELLRLVGVRYAARLAAALVCALAGGLAAGAFLVLLRRLGLPPPRARLWTLVFATSASQVVFSSVPESYAISGLSLVVVFAVAAAPAPSLAARAVAGVFSFGVTVTNLVAVVLAAAAGRNEPLRVRLRRTAIVAGLVVSATAALALVQRALYPSAEVFFLPGRLGSGYNDSLFPPTGPGALARRAGGVVSHLLFAGLAAPRLRSTVLYNGQIAVDFEPVALLDPTALGLVHWVTWALLLARAAWGLRRTSVPPVVHALVAWLAFLASLHLVFGASLFLYSAHWVFAVVALAAAGEAAAGARRIPRLAVSLVVLLQLAVNGGLLWELLRTFRPRG